MSPKSRLGWGGRLIDKQGPNKGDGCTHKKEMGTVTIVEPAVDQKSSHESQSVGDGVVGHLGHGAILGRGESLHIEDTGDVKEAVGGGMENLGEKDGLF